MNPSIAGTADTRAALDRLLAELRPKLHRYCARMTGSVIDGEDVVQEALVKAIEAFPASGIDRPSGRLAVSHRPQRGAGLSASPHPTGVRSRRRGSGHDRRSRSPPPTIARSRPPACAPSCAFRLPQRSSVILMDVLGYSLEEIGDVMDSSVPAVKAALHRGRARLRELAQEPDDAPLPGLAEPERSRSPRMSSASTRATSTPYATCSPTRCGSSSSRGRE